MLGQCQRGLGNVFHHRHWLFLGGPPLAQRCLSDPGADSPSNLHRKGFKEHLLSKDAYDTSTCGTFLTKQRHLKEIIIVIYLFILNDLLCSETSHHAFFPPQVKENLISVWNGSKCQTPRLAPPQLWAKPTTPLGPAPTLCLTYSKNSSAPQHPAPSRLPACVRLVQGAFATRNASVQAVFFFQACIKNEIIILMLLET